MTELTDGREGQTKTGREKARTQWALSRGLLTVVASIALLSGLIAGAVAFGATRDSGSTVRVYATPTVAAAYTEPATETPADTPSPDETTAVTQPATATPIVTQAPTVTASGIATDPAGPTVASSVSTTPTLTPTTTPTIGEPWSATPVPYTPAPSTTLATTAAELVAAIEDEWGIDVVTSGQDWGTSEADQLRNLGELAGALEMLPGAIVADATHNDHGTLAVLSNNHGRTLSGWQPYGDRAANFYTNEDWAGSSRQESSQIVLQPGTDRMTIAHELLHSYQMRDVQPGSYGLALLTPEMSDFMTATGWVQLVSDDELEDMLHRPWDEIEDLYRYEGSDLTYTSSSGYKVQAYTPNPIEAFAVVGALYYAAPEGTELPDWPEYWDWFDANLG